MRIGFLLSSTNSGWARSAAGKGLFAAVLALVAGCAAVFPEVATPLKAVPEGRVLEPAPPEDLLYLEIVRARIPAKTRDGRNWDSVGGALPDPVAIIFVGDEELFRTSVQSNTLEPTWPDQPKGNYRVPVGAKVRVELWDSNAMNDMPICRRRVEDIHSDTDLGSVSVNCDGGTIIDLAVRPAQAQLGLGLFYELRTVGVNVTRTVPESPAGRAGLKPGDVLVSVMGKQVKDMEEGEVQSLINANAQLGVKLVVKHEGGQQKELELKEGPVYVEVDRASR